MLLWSKVKNWFHHLFNPHCELCVDCQNCEILKAQLSIANYQNEKLLESIVAITRPTPATNDAIESNPPAPLRPHIRSWSRQRAELEANSRAVAQAAAQAKKDIVSVNDPDFIALEKELEIAESEREKARAGV